MSVQPSLPLTKSRLRIDGEYVMLITTGTAKTFPREKLKEINWYEPQAFVELDCAPESFIKCMRSNHIHAVYGDFGEHLQYVCVRSWISNRSRLRGREDFKCLKNGN